MVSVCSLGCGIGYGYLHRIPTQLPDAVQTSEPSAAGYAPSAAGCAPSAALDPNTAAQAIKAANAGIILSVRLSVK